MKTQLQSLKAELNYIDHILNGWENYKIIKNIKPTEANQWKSLENYNLIL